MSIAIAFLLTTLRLATPLLYGSLGGYCSERSGTINIALEGLLLIGAFAAAAAAFATHNPWLAILIAVLAATLLACLHGFLCIEVGSDQIISGMAINFLSIGMTPVFCKSLYDMSGGSPLLTANDRLPSVLGTSPLLLFALVLILLFWLVHRSTKLGQYLRFAGENALALETQGISVRKIRWYGVLFSGALCGLGGAYLSIDHGGGFARNMVAGRGYIALAALIIGRWTPGGALIASLSLGAVEAIQVLLQGMKLPGGEPLPVQWIQVIPYTATLLVLAKLARLNHNKSTHLT